MNEEEMCAVLSCFVLEVRQEKVAGREYTQKALVSIVDGLFRFVNDERKQQGLPTWYVVYLRFYLLIFL